MSLASSLRKYADPNADDVGLVVDDVWFEYKFQRIYKRTPPTKIHNQIHRWVVFARRPTNDGVRALFTMPE